MLPIDEVCLCPIQLRPVRKETLEYLQFKDDIKANGILQSLTCRERDKYEIYLGRHRYEIARELRIKMLPCIIREASDDEIELLQMSENGQGVPTDPVDYARRLWRIIEVEKTKTLPELAHDLHKNIDWTRRMLKLVQLCPEAEQLMATNQLSLAEGVELAKLPFEDQQELLNVIGGVPIRESVELIRRKARHYRQDAKNERVGQRLLDTLEVRPIFRDKGELLSELEEPTMMASVFNACEAKTDGEKWQAVLKYVFRIDPETKKKRILENKNE